MSSTTAVTPSPSPSDPQNGSGPPPDNSGNGGGPSSSLYLFTFLATLFLLLFVSSAIILRSFILRRRFRQRIEEAILAGVIVPNNPTGRVSRRRALGEKPKLWETYVFPADDDRWDSIVPVSALPKASELVATTEGSEVASAPPRSISPISLPPHPRPLYQRMLRNPFSRRRDSLTPPLVDMANVRASSNENVSGQSALPHHDRMQVTVLITMPDPRRRHPDGKGKEKNLDFDYDEDDLPEMVLGMADSHYKDDPSRPTTP